jgi:fructokinase
MSQSDRSQTCSMIVICGEAIVDFIPDPGRPGGFTATPGGGPVNTAVALARLGTPTSMLARLSSDGFGRMLRAHLASNDVGLTGAVEAAEPSSLAIAAIGPEGSADYRFLVAGTADWGWTDAELGAVPADVAAVHSGSLATAMAPGAAAVERWLARARETATVSFDPNIRAALIDDLPAHRTTVERCVALADLVKVSRDDLEVLYPGREAIAVARRWLEGGPAAVVVTDGAAGSVGLTTTAEIQCPAAPGPVIDTIGAGDTFAGALLDWLSRAGRLGGRLTALSDSDLGSALEQASLAAAITCGRVGADPPYRDEMLAATGSVGSRHGE